MKKAITILFACILFSLVTQGQITKGNWMMGGNASYSLTTFNSELNSDNTGYVVRIEPDIGFCLVNKVITGLKSNIVITGSKATGSSVYSNYTDFNIGPFIRYYFLSEENIINVLAEAAYQYGFEGSGTSDRTGKKISKNTFGFSAGPVIYFNSAVSLELLAGYSIAKYVNVKGRNGTVGLSIGIQVYLKKDD